MRAASKLHSRIATDKRMDGTTFRHFRRLLGYVWPHKRYLYPAVACILLVAVSYSAGIGSIYPVLKIMIAPDHPTPCTTTAHDGTPPPFCYAGTGIEAAGSPGFSEKHARASGVHVDPGIRLIDAFMRR